MSEEDFKPRCLGPHCPDYYEAYNGANTWAGVCCSCMEVAPGHIHLWFPISKNLTKMMCHCGRVELWTGENIVVLEDNSLARSGTTSEPSPGVN